MKLKEWFFVGMQKFIVFSKSVTLWLNAKVVEDPNLSENDGK